MSTAKNLASGAIARLTRHAHHLREGETVRIDDYIDAQEAEDGRAFCWVSDPSGSGFSGFDIDADALEVVMNATEAAERVAPTPYEVARSIDWLNSSSDYVEFDEADWSTKDGTVELGGTAENGLRIRAVVRVEFVETADF